MRKFLKWLGIVVVLVIAGLIGWLAVAPPDLIRVAVNYSAKMVCSNVFLAGRNADEVLAVDVQAPGHPILKFVSVDVDESAGTVRAGLFGLFGGGLAVARGERGCASAPDGNATVAAVAPRNNGIAMAATRADAQWPDGNTVEPSQNPDITAILDNPDLTGPGMRGLVIVHNGRIIGERYGEGFDAETPLLGWSMTKTVTSAIIGTLVRAGKISLDQTELFDSWKGDERAKIKLSDLLAMSSGLAWNEGYGSVSDVTRMLYLEPDMPSFVSSKPYDPANGNPEDDRLFNYSSGTTVMLSNIWQRAVGDGAQSYPDQALFGPLRMTSAVLEADAGGTLVGSSYLYATARDWARFGQFMLQRGVWNGRSLLPVGYADWMRDPATHSMAVWGKHEYGKGHLWLHGPTAGTPDDEDPDQGFDLPDDAFWMLGHDGQTTTIIPTLDLVIVRLGLTPSDLKYKPQGLVEAVVKVLN